MEVSFLEPKILQRLEEMRHQVHVGPRAFSHVLLLFAVIFFIKSLVFNGVSPSVTNLQVLREKPDAFPPKTAARSAGAPHGGE